MLRWECTLIHPVCFRPEVEEADVLMLNDCYTCLTCVSGSAEGRLALVKHGTVATLASVISRDLYGE